jgi:hypothetical protein
MICGPGRNHFLWLTGLKGAQMWYTPVDMLEVLTYILTVG